MVNSSCEYRWDAKQRDGAVMVHDDHGCLSYVANVGES